ncbi:MAG: hypothetical protein KDD44_10115, partial [Bdellovibrionales bacterium]|nr:hypothetical protein [Bdellovibrionales bacterium]
EESLIDRRSELQSTEEFIDSQLREARQRLEETEAQVQEFVRNNFKQLPEHLDAAVARLDSLQAQLTTNGQLMTANTVRKESLEAELGLALKQSSALSAAAGDSASNPREALQQLRAALVVLQSKYSDRHPDVIKTKERINALEQQLDSPSANSRSVRSYESPQVAAIRSQLNEVNARLAALDKENLNLKQAIDELQVDIQTMPLKEQELLKIKRDYANVKANYERLLKAKEDASLQNSLARSQKASQFRIVEPAELPAFAAGPHRELFIAAGVFVSAGIFISLLFVLYFLNGAYKERDELEQSVNLPVLGIIPPMNTPEAVAYERRLSSVSLFATVLSLVTGSMLIVFLVGNANG